MKQTIFRRLVLLSLSGFLLFAILPLQSAFARNSTQQKRATLCGRLVFLEDYKTQARLIGLIPCNESRPLIFAARPGELFDFYRLTNVVIKKDDRVLTTTYGALENYITRFDSYQQIGSCQECSPGAEGFQPPSAEQASDCTAWVLEQAAAAFPAASSGQEFEAIQANLQAFAGGEVVNRACGVDRACRIGAAAQQLGVQLGPRLRWGEIQAEQVIDWLAGLLSNPAAAEACPSLGVVAPKLAAGLNQQGYGIDLAAISQGCDLLAVDAQGLQTGFAGESSVEQIPGARAAATQAGQVLLLPAGAASHLGLACKQSAYADLWLVQRDQTGIREYTFTRLAVQAGTRGQVELSASPLVLSLDPRGDGAITERQPNRSLLHPALVAPIPSPAPTSTPAPPTATAAPTAEATPTASPTTYPPSPTPAPVEPPAPTPTPASPIGPAGLCPQAFGLALLPGWAIVAKTRSCRRRRTV
jgi:hypothetical protein